MGLLYFEQIYNPLAIVVLLLTSSVAFPMNFALFHQVIVAGGLDPELRHSSTAMRDTEKGSVGGVMVTVCGKTEKYRKEKKTSNLVNYALLLITIS